MGRGFFISIEGTDGSGKTTQIELMKKYFMDKGKQVVFIREPGGTKIGEKIRGIVLDEKNTEMCYKTEMLLYAAARAQLVHETISPLIEKGCIVICDRYVDSSYVYQGMGRNLELDDVIYVNNIATNELMPDITFFFDIHPKKALKRKMKKNDADRIEQEKEDFHVKVYEGYKKLCSLYPKRIIAIDADKSIDEVFKSIQKHIKNI